MYRSVKEERMEKQLKGIVRTVIWAGVLLLVGSVLFAMILSDATDRAAAYQLHARTEEYSSRLYEQIDSDYQIMDTFASIIGSSGSRTGRIFRSFWTRPIMKMIFSR